MGYTELKREYDAARMSLADLGTELNRLTQSISATDSSKNDLRDSIEKQVLEDKARALDAYKDSRVKPVEDKLDKLSDELQKTETEYKNKMEDITFDNILEECSSKQEILDNVRESSSALKEKLQKIVGKRFYKSLMKQVNTDKIKLDADQMDPVIGYFNRSDKKLGSISTDLNTFDKIIQKLEGLGKEKEDRTFLIILLVLIVVGAVFIPFYMAIFIISFLTISSVYNIYRNYSIYQTLCVVLAVEANIEQIETSMHEEVAQEVENRKTDLDSEYLPKIDKLKEDIQATKQALIDTEQEASSSFIYDATAFENERTNAERKIDDRRANLLLQKSQIEDQMKEKTDLINKLASELALCTEEIKSKLMSEVGTQMEFKPDFVVDIVDNKPVAWKHPRASSLFLYKDEAELYDFIKLITVQLRAKLVPTCLSVIAVDFKNMGQDLQMFTSCDQKDEIMMNTMFKIDINKEMWKADLDILNKDLKMRQKSISTEFKTIERYNQKMIELEAIPEKYKFIFMIEPELTSLLELDATQLLRIGDTYGIYFHVFISFKQLAEGKNNASELLEHVKSVYAIENGSIRKRAKAFIVDNYLSE